MKDLSGYVYIMTSEHNTALYTGVTADLKKRVWQHKEKFVAGFTKTYNLEKLVYWESCGNIVAAIEREKQIKGGSRRDKMALIEEMNPEWRDLYEAI